MIIEQDIWLSKITGKTCGILADNHEEEITISDHWDFISAKLAPEAHTLIDRLQQTGFRFIETAVSFQRDPENTTASTQPAGLLVLDRGCFVETAIRQAVGDIAATRFIHNRFSVDPQIGPDTGGRIKRAWAENFFDGKRGDKLLINMDTDTKRVNGFLILIETPEKLIIDLVATAAISARKGVGRTLVQYAAALADTRGIPIIVGTQASNIASCKLYQACGFHLSHLSCNFHWHASS